MQMPHGRNVLGLSKGQLGGQCGWRVVRGGGVGGGSKIPRAFCIIVRTSALAPGEIGTTEESEPESPMI